jgi:pentapeptide MXKDX repeat protein
MEAAAKAKAKARAKKHVKEAAKNGGSTGGGSTGADAAPSTETTVVVEEQLEALRGVEHAATRGASTTVFNELLQERCGLLALVATATDLDSNAERRVYRFPHLTFQEFFASEGIVADIERDLMRAEGMRAEGMRVEGMREEGMRAEGMRAEGMREEGMRAEGMRAEGMRVEGKKAEGIHHRAVKQGGRVNGDGNDGGLDTKYEPREAPCGSIHQVFSRHLGEGEESKLYDVWYREVVLFVASGLQMRSFALLVEWLLANDDGSGAVQVSKRSACV